MKTLVALMLSAGLISNAGAATTSLSETVLGNFSKTYTFSVSAGYVGTLLGNINSFFDDVYGEWAGFKVNSVLLNSSPLTLVTSSVTDEIDGSDWTSTVAENSFGANALAAGSYTLTVKGFAYTSSNLNGSFSVAQNAVPVPEPTELGMLLIGLGLISFASRRKAA